MNYLFGLLILFNIYIILSLSLNLLVGYTGLLSMGHAAFFGIGAYTSALLVTTLGVDISLTIPIAAAGTALLSLIISLPSLRLRGDYFVLATFALQLITFDVLYNLTPLTGGSLGVQGIPRPSTLGLSLDTPARYFLFSSVVAGLALFFLRRLLSAPFGRVLKAIREDEIEAQSLGKRVTAIKVKAFAVAGGLAAVAGVLFAHYVTYIDPTSFTLEESIFLLSMVLVGGAGNIKGPIVGAAVLLIVPEVLRFVGVPDTVAPNVRQMLYGVLLILFMYCRPQGIAGEYRLGRV